MREIVLDWHTDYRLSFRYSLLYDSLLGMICLHFIILVNSFYIYYYTATITHFEFDLRFIQIIKFGCFSLVQRSY